MEERGRARHGMLITQSSRSKFGHNTPPGNGDSRGRWERGSRTALIERSKYRWRIQEAYCCSPSQSFGVGLSAIWKNRYGILPKAKSRPLTMYLWPRMTQVTCDDACKSVTSECCLLQSELSVGSSRDRQVRANETADCGLVSTNSPMNSLSSSSISKIGFNMNRREERNAEGGDVLSS